MEGRWNNMDQGANFLKALEGLAVKKDVQSASAARAAPHIFKIRTGKSVEKENNVLKGNDDSGDDGNDIFTEALWHTNVLSPASSINPSSPAVRIVPSIPICTTDNYGLCSQKRERSSTRAQDEGIKIHVVPAPRTRIIKASLLPATKRK